MLGVGIGGYDGRESYYNITNTTARPVLSV